MCTSSPRHTSEKGGKYSRVDMEARVSRISEGHVEGRTLPVVTCFEIRDSIVNCSMSTSKALKHGGLCTQGSRRTRRGTRPSAATRTPRATYLPQIRYVQETACTYFTMIHSSMVYAVACYELRGTDHLCPSGVRNVNTDNAGRS